MGLRIESRRAFRTLWIGVALVSSSFSATAQRSDDLHERLDELQAKVDTLLEQQEARQRGLEARGGDSPRAGRPEFRSDREYVGLLEHLELGASALRELGLESDLERIEEIADMLRRERRQARGRPGENDEVRTVRRRLSLMRWAVEALVEAGMHERAGLVEHAMHSRELILAGRDDPEALRIRESAPDRRQLSEQLKFAAEFLTERGASGRAGALAELSEIYAEQWRRRERAGPSQREARSGLASLDRRVDVLRLARDAYDAGGRREPAAVLERCIHFGELGLSGASPEKLRVASGEIPGYGALVELLRGAARILGESGSSDSARACTSLAELYSDWMSREEEELEDDSTPAADLDERATRVEIIGIAHAALEKAGWETAADQMRRFERIGQLQLRGASDEQLREVDASGLSMALLTEHIRQAARLYREWSDLDHARRCTALADFYEQR